MRLVCVGLRQKLGTLDDACQRTLMCALDCVFVRLVCVWLASLNVAGRLGTSYNVCMRLQTLAHVLGRLAVSILLSCVHLRQIMRSNPREMTCINVCLTHNNVVPGSTNKPLDLGLCALL